MKLLRKIQLFLLFAPIFCAGQIRLDADPYWAVGNRAAVRLNFSAGLSLPSVGMVLIDSLGRRYIRCYVNRDLPKVGLNYRDEWQYLPLDSTENNPFYGFIMRPIQFTFDNRNFVTSQWKQGPYYPQLSISVRPVLGVYKLAAIVQYDTIHPTPPTPQKTTTYFFNDFKNEVETTVDAEVNWQSDYTGWVKIYINGVKQKFNIGGVIMDSIPGPNMDRAYNLSGPRQRPYWRGGDYQHTWGDISTPPIIKTRTILYRRVRVAGPATTREEFLGIPVVTPLPPVVETGGLQTNWLLKQL